MLLGSVGKTDTTTKETSRRCANRVEVGPKILTLAHRLQFTPFFFPFRSLIWADSRGLWLNVLRD